MALDTRGMKAIKLRLERDIGVGIPNAMELELNVAARQMEETARNMAPIDYGDLRDAITLRRYGVQGAGGRFIKGFSRYSVFIDMNRPVRDPQKLEDGYTIVGDYAWDVHEHMGFGSVRRDLMPSKKSIEAGKAAGVVAGGEFMRRAAREVAAKHGELLLRLQRVNQNYLHKLDK